MMTLRLIWLSLRNLLWLAAHILAGVLLAIAGTILGFALIQWLVEAALKAGYHL
jgi:hypothetical protein